METFANLSRETLLEYLTEYYDRYRTIQHQGANDREYAACRLGLRAVLEELSRRNQSDPASYQSRDFIFTRTSER